jgi:hypothetical protein
MNKIKNKNVREKVGIRGGMKMILIAFVVVFAIPTFSQQPAPVEQPRKPQLAELYLESDFVSVDGFWEPDNPTKHNELVPTATHIECYRHGGKELVGTDAICITSTAMAPTGTLTAGFSMDSASWSDDEIVISDSHPICLTSKTFFDLKRKTVIALDVRKPEATGLGNACKLVPDRQSYYLRDQVDYTLFHVPVKKDAAPAR